MGRSSHAVVGGGIVSGIDIVVTTGAAGVGAGVSAGGNVCFEAGVGALATAGTAEVNAGVEAGVDLCRGGGPW